jgi:hypothetical protein
LSRLFGGHEDADSRWQHRHHQTGISSIRWLALHTHCRWAELLPEFVKKINTDESRFRNMG